MTPRELLRFLNPFTLVFVLYTSKLLLLYCIVVQSCNSLYIVL
jgi:hypothetical protein